MLETTIRSDNTGAAGRCHATGPDRAGRLATQRKRMWRPDFARIRGKVYLAIAQQIEEAIRLGVFEPGDRLPAQRAIAADLGFSINTINAAFREAARRGLVRANTGCGTIVLPIDGRQDTQ